MSSQKMTVEEMEKELADLGPIFAKASVGDFSQDITLPPGDSAVTEIYAGVQIMLDVIREKIADLEQANARLSHEIEDLARLNRLMIGRELKMKELKQEVSELKRRLDLPTSDT